MSTPVSNPLVSLIERHGLDVISVVGCDFHGIARGKMIPARRLVSGERNPFRMSNIVAMLDYASMPYPAPVGDTRWWPSWQEGYTDTRAVVDAQTARLVPWQRATGLVICDFERVDGTGPLDYLPRPTLRRLIDRLTQHGFETLAAVEPEFMLFRETEASAIEKGYRNLTPLWQSPQAYCLTTLGQNDGPIRQIRDHLEGFGLPIDTWNVEAGPGQVEMNLPPASAMQAADQGFLFKHAVKEIASTLGLQATFIPKLSKLGFGNGNHLNFSLWKDGRNAFHTGNPANPRSPVMLRFVNGVVKTLREFTLLYAPTVNAYRRFMPYYSTGMVVSWGHDNKSVAVRTVAESAAMARLEQRTAGGDVNPYILLAACIAGGLYGLEHELEPVEPVLGDAYARANLPCVPSRIDDAIELFEQSRIANEYLGEDFVRLFALGRRMEASSYSQATGTSNEPADVTDWELSRYFIAA